MRKLFPEVSGQVVTVFTPPLAGFGFAELARGRRDTQPIAQAKANVTNAHSTHLQEEIHSRIVICLKPNNFILTPFKHKKFLLIMSSIWLQ